LAELGNFVSFRIMNHHAVSRRARITTGPAVSVGDEIVCWRRHERIQIVEFRS
jgi:hypothetical protein